MHLLHRVVEYAGNLSVFCRNLIFALLHIINDALQAVYELDFLKKFIKRLDLLSDVFAVFQALLQIKQRCCAFDTDTI